VPGSSGQVRRSGRRVRRTGGRARRASRRVRRTRRRVRQVSWQARRTSRRTQQANGWALRRSGQAQRRQDEDRGKNGDGDGDTVKDSVKDTATATGTRTQTRTRSRTRRRGWEQGLGPRHRQGLGDGVNKLLRTDLRRTMALIIYSNHIQMATTSRQQTANTYTDIPHSNTSGTTHSHAPESICSITFPTSAVRCRQVIPSTCDSIDM
jgi:hypothetical protein